MVKLNINLDESLKAFADEQVALGRARSVDDLLAALLADERRRSGKQMAPEGEGDSLRHQIQQGIDSGPAQPWTAQEFDEARERIARRNQHRG